jgi:hypothetical protein
LRIKVPCQKPTARFAQQPHSFQAQAAPLMCRVFNFF